MKQAIKLSLVVALAFLGIEKLFGCKHKRFSFPQTRRIGGRRAGIYIVCLKCGTEFEYDFEQMKITGEAFYGNGTEREDQDNKFNRLMRETQGVHAPVADDRKA